VQHVLQLLLREQVPIRQLATIFETLGQYASRTKEPVVLAELVRSQLARAISTRYRDTDGRLSVIVLDRSLEDTIHDAVELTEDGFLVRMPMDELDELCESIGSASARLTSAGRAPVLLVSPQIRAAVRHLTASRLPRLVVLSYNEMTRDTQVEAVERVGQTQAVS
jgi:flagellar biosynthesis protein FlhA